MPSPAQSTHLARFGLQAPLAFEPTGCERCADRGYLGRTAIFELLEVIPRSASYRTAACRLRRLPRPRPRRGCSRSWRTGSSRSPSGRPLLEKSFGWRMTGATNGATPPEQPDLRAILLARAERWAQLERALLLTSALATLGLAAILSWHAVQSLAPWFGSTGIRAPAEVTIYATGESAPPAVAGSKGVVETESEANGFLLVIETEPDGAVAQVDGVTRGETPASMNLDCQPGAPVKVVLTRRGWATLKHTVTCRENRMVVLEARLQPLAPSSGR